MAHPALHPIGSLNLTQFTTQKNHSTSARFPVSMHPHLGYTASTSQPHTEVTTHKDVRRHHLSRFVSTFSATMVCLSIGAGPIGCAARQAPPPAPAPPRHIQVLVQAGPALNLGDDGQPWPTAWTLYQLRADPEARAPLDWPAVLANPESTLGNLVLGQHPHTAFPSTAARFTVELAPEVTHLLALARFREPLGDASYLLYAVPRRDAACLYLGLDRSELDGGPFPPAGFDAALFATTCPPATTR